MGVQLTSKLPQLADAIEKETSRIVRETAFDVERNIKESMAEPKHGRIYDGHQASAPGEAPAIDLGSYVNTIQTEMISESLAGVFTNDERGPLFELGGVKIEPRPHFEPALEAEQDDFERKMSNLGRGLK